MKPTLLISSKVLGEFGPRLDEILTGAGAQADAVGLACVSGVLALARGVEIFLRNLSNYLRARPLENEASVI